jgi:hypothetical protein
LKKPINKRSLGVKSPVAVFPLDVQLDMGEEIHIVSLVVMDFVRAARLVEQVAAEN